MSTAVHYACTMCGKENGRLCNGCKSARYCSTACQKADWRIHKLLCSSFASFDISSRPTDDHILAILFPPREKKPRPVWLECEWVFGDGYVRIQLARAEPFLGEYGTSIPIQYSTALKRNLSNTLYIAHRDSFLTDGSKPNASVAGITATKPGKYHDWRGPIIAYSRDGDSLEPPKCRDIDLSDFRHIADHFLTYLHEPAPNSPAPNSQRSAETTVQGVRINCIGDYKLLGRPQFEAVEVPSTAAIFSKHDTSDIADRIGLPILTSKCPPDQQWPEKEDSKLSGHGSPFNNQPATFLHLCCNPNAKFDLRLGSMGWGWAPPQWQNRVGSVLVVRKDQKPLSPFHVQALCEYSQFEIRPLLAHSIGEFAPEEPMSKDAVLNMICRATFVIYWSKFWDRLHESGNRVFPDSPYLV